jgi:hypothetical protein
VGRRQHARHRLRDGLIKQARSNVTGAQQGAPASDAVIFDIVDYERALSFAQLIIPSVGRLDFEGAHGGPEAASAQALVDGGFDLFQTSLGFVFTRAEAADLVAFLRAL